MIKIKVEGEKEENQQKLRKKRIKYNEEIEQLKVVVVDVGGGGQWYRDWTRRGVVGEGMVWLKRARPENGKKPSARRDLAVSE